MIITERKITASKNSISGLNWRDQWLAWALLLVCAPMLYWSISSALVRLTNPFPQSPWESQILTDALLVSRGEKAYTNPQSSSGHATHMYGPLITYAIGWSFKFTGFELTIGRWMALVSSTAAAIALAMAIARKQGLAMTLIVFTLLFYQFYRGRAYFAETRPDCLSIVFSILALWLMFKAVRDNLAWLIPALAILLVSFLFKQTAAAFAIVPVVYWAISRSRSSKSLWIVSITPIVLMVGVVLCSKLVMPNLYFHLFVIAAKFELQPWRWPGVFLDIATTNLFFLVLVTLWVSGLLHCRYSPGTTRWLIAIAIVSVLSSSLAVAKSGGGENSYIPAYLSLAVLGAGLLNQWNAEVSVRARQAASVILLLAFAADAYSLHGRANWYNPGPANGDRSYSKVIATAASLPGVVLSPDDPTISLRAKGILSRNSVCELDTTGQREFPAALLKEWSAADYIIRTQGMWTSKVPVEELTKMGFKQVSIEGFDSGSYSFWKRAKSVEKKRARKVAPATQRTASAGVE